MAKKVDIGDQLVKLVDTYTSTTSEQDVAAAEKKYRKEQEEAKKKADELRQFRLGLNVATGAAAMFLTLLALRSFSRARAIA
jgi:hypothetical protein